MARLKRHIRVQYDLGKIFEAAVRRGYSQRDLARRTQLTEETISRLAQRKHQPKAETVQKLAAVVGLRYADLVVDVQEDFEVGAQNLEKVGMPA